MKPLYLTLAVLAATPLGIPCSAQQPERTRQPSAYIAANLAIEPSTAAVGTVSASLEVPVGRFARPWVSAGGWIFGKYSCIPEAPGPCNSQGTTYEAGADFVSSPPSTFLLPFFGAGLGLRFQEHGGRALRPLVRAGADLQLSQWLAPRIQVELSSYPHWGGAVLLGGGLRLGIPPLR